jgi:hypothetical protein
MDKKNTSKKKATNTTDSKQSTIGFSASAP